MSRLHEVVNQNYFLLKEWLRRLFGSGNCSWKPR